MCGIAGFQSRGAHHPPDSSLRIIRAMISTLVHRGPDDSGVWIDPEVGLAFGHRRLSILDLSTAGRQPMVSRCGGYVLIYNGEIYNFPELRHQLEQRGYTFRGHSDTEVLLAAIACWGVAEVLPRLNGMFAFALWDRGRRCLTLARDRTGKKPLYYGWCRNGSFVFGSESKALRAHPDFDPEVDRDALGLFVQYSWIPAPYSIYARVRQLPAGNMLTVTSTSAPNQIQPSTYWSAREEAERNSRTPLSMSPEAATSAVEDLLRAAVTKRMTADVGLGAFLSGGIDSSTVVALMQSISAKPVQTFAIGYHETKYNEAEYAKAIARHLKTDHTELYVTPADCLDVISKLPVVYDEPFADYSQIPTYLVSRLARQKVTVALSGDGGDELFGGYEAYVHDLRDWQRQLMLWQHCPSFARRGLTALIANLGPGGRRLLRPRKGADASVGWVRAKLANKLRRVEQRGRRILPHGTGAELHARLRAHVARADELVIGARPVASALTDPRHWADVSDPVLAMMFVDFVTYLTDDVLTKVDRASMGVSLEVRCPLLDPAIVVFAWRLPSSMRIGPNGGKLIMRNLLARYVPRDLFERPKRGFNVPIVEWLRGPLRDWAEDLLDPRRLHEQGFLNARAVRQVWQEHLAGRQPHAFLVWSLIMFQAWYEVWGRSEQTNTAVEAA
jgi:asparagine synthase (glutamine-hydrolysing)